MKTIASHLCGITLISFLISSPAFSQVRKDTTVNDYASNPRWIEMMQAPNPNFYEIRNAFYTYWQGRTTHRGDGYKPFKRWENYWQWRVNEDGSFPKSGEVARQYYKFVASQPYAPGFKSGNAQWKELGPKNRVDVGGYCGIGRLNAIACSPADTSTIYVAAPSGGVWKTTDGGKTWVPLCDNLPSLGASSILIHPTKPNEILVGTGDRDGSDARGIGVIRSTDGGASWDISNNGMGELTVGMMDRNPMDPDCILAATSSGIYKSTNAGQNWTKKSTVGSSYKDIKFKPGSPTVAYAVCTSGATGFYRTEDAGENWAMIPDSCGAPTSGRIVIGVTSAASNLVYLAKGDPFYFYVSQDDGKHFTLQATSPNILGYDTYGTDAKTQTWYDLCIAVDPLVPQTVFVGGINLWRTDNSGKAWRIIGHWTGSGAPEIHADQHALYVNPVNKRVYAGNDGGIYYTDNKGVSWTERSIGLGIGQIYRIGVSTINPYKTAAGFQDNGSAVWTGTDWLTVGGGDGMETAIDPTDYMYSYSTIYYGSITQLFNNNSTRQVGGIGIGGINEEGAWVTPFIIHQDDGNTMLAGYKNVWITHDLKNSNAISWKKITDNLGGRNDVYISALEQSPAQPQMLYFTRADRKLYRTDNFNLSKPVWVDLTPNLPVATTPSAVECHPFDPMTVYIGLYGRIYKSSDKGETWTDISGSLPRINMNSILYDVTSNEGLYVGTDAGVYFRDASMTDWVFYNTNMPVSVEASELEAYYDHLDRTKSRLRSSTFGRGLWETPLAEATPILPATFLTAEKGTNKIKLYWNAPFYPQYVTQYKVYRNNILYGNTTSPYYTDDVVEYNTDYTYKIVAEYANSTDAEPSNTVSVILTDAVTIPYFADFESSTAGWGSAKNTANWKYGTQSDLDISGNTGSFFGIHGDLDTYNNKVSDCLTSPLIDFSNNIESGITLSFNYCFVRKPDLGTLNVVYRVSKDSAWTSFTELANTHSVNWKWDSVSVVVPKQALTAATELGFLFKSNGSAYQGAGIDDIKIVPTAQSNGTNGINILQACRIFPNPNQGVFQLELTPKRAGNISIQIVNLSGQVVLEEKIRAGEGLISKSFDLRSQAKGIYQVRVQTDDGVWADRITIQ